MDINVKDRLRFSDAGFIYLDGNEFKHDPYILGDLYDTLRWMVFAQFYTKLCAKSVNNKRWRDLLVHDGVLIWQDRYKTMELGLLIARNGIERSKVLELYDQFEEVANVRGKNVLTARTHLSENKMKIIGWKKVSPYVSGFAEYRKIL